MDGSHLGQSWAFSIDTCSKSPVNWLALESTFLSGFSQSFDGFKSGSGMKSSYRKFFRSLNIQALMGGLDLTIAVKSSCKLYLVLAEYGMMTISRSTILSIFSRRSSRIMSMFSDCCTEGRLILSSQSIRFYQIDLIYTKDYSRMKLVKLF